MNLSRPFTAAGLAATAAAAMIGAGVANAAPSGSGDLFNNPALINTTCTYNQVSEALTATDPQTAAALNAQPAVQTRMRQFLSTPPAQRQALEQQWIAQNPAQANQARQMAQQHPDQVNHAQNVINQVTRTCARNPR